MGKIADANKEKKECVNVLNLLSQNNSDSQRINGSFSRFPNGYFINDSIDSDLFFNETIKEPSNRDRLSKLLSSIKFIKKLGTSSFEIAIPSVLLEKKEKISAIKLLNDSLVLWTESFVYKIPTSEKSILRIEMTKENIKIICELDSELQSFFLIPKFIETPGLTLQYSVKCDTFTLDRNTVKEIDIFLQKYFKKVLNSASLQDCILRGFQHSDLHFRNILRDKNNKYYLTDLDLIKSNGFPFLDLMHFAIHLVRTIEKTTQYEPLEQFLIQKSTLYDKLVKYNFIKLSDIWLQYYHDDYIEFYIQNQIEWYHYNRVHSDELIQLEELKKKFEIC